jgi:SSS family solute:Na+ symporter
MIPQLFMRLYVAKDVEHFRQMSFLYGLVPFVLHILPVCIGVWGVVSFPGLMGKEADRILPMMLDQHTHAWFAALIMIGAIAAFMSTLDSQLLALSTMVTRDFVLPVRKTPLRLKKQALLGKGLVVLFAVIGCGFAFCPFDTLFEIVKLAFAGFAVLFPIVFAVVKLGGLDPRYGIVSVVVGQLLIMTFFFGWLPSSWLFGFESYMLALIVCFVICLWGNRVAKKRMRRLS